MINETATMNLGSRLLLILLIVWICLGLVISTVPNNELGGGIITTIGILGLVGLAAFAPSIEKVSTP
jgi:hypothetical protein